MKITPIEAIREEFESIDKSILILLHQRMELSIKMSLLKKQNSLPVLDLIQWNKQSKNRFRENEKFGINPDFIQSVFNLIHEESIRIQNQEINK
ncbi:MAG: chorismate mutase [Bacteroidetes bacterium]|nr:chorismate mutase [Bacteroidota bacterium]